MLADIDEDGYRQFLGTYMKTTETEKLHQHLRDVFNSPDYETAEARADKLIEFYQNHYPDLADWLEEAIEGTLTVFRLPDKHPKTIKDQ